MAGLSGKTRAAIIGASGYTGAELVRLLLNHPHIEITALTAARKAGQAMAQAFPHLGGIDLPDLVRVEDVDWSAIDVAFCGLPHGTTQEIIAGLPEHIKIVDLSADFRLADVDLYASVYGDTHKAPQLQETAVYGLTEINRDAIANARLVANPGCYPTASQLPLIPLIEAGVIEKNDIIIDAKSGVSGAGRAAKEGSLYTEVSGGIHAYGVATHRHAPEIEQGLALAAGESVVVNFTPHLMPMSRGILASIYVKTAPGKTAADLRAVLAARYADAAFVQVLAEGQSPATRHVAGSNQCRMAVFADRVPGRAIVLCVIDNLVKGASGQAIQNLNVMMGWPETTGLELAPIFP